MAPHRPCLGRPFPGTLDEETFTQAADYASRFEAFYFHYNNSYYSKLAMGPFAETIISNIERRAAGEIPLKFATFLGADHQSYPDAYACSNIKTLHMSL